MTLGQNNSFETKLDSLIHDVGIIDVEIEGQVLTIAQEYTGDPKTDSSLGRVRR